MKNASVALLIFTVWILSGVVFDYFQQKNKLEDYVNDKIGALWQTESAKGTYYTGSIEVGGEVIKVVVFKNGYKKESKHPDMIIYKSRPRDKAAESETSKDDSDIPF